MRERLGKLNGPNIAAEPVEQAARTGADFEYRRAPQGIEFVDYRAVQSSFDTPGVEQADNTVIASYGGGRGIAVSEEVPSPCVPDRKVWRQFASLSCAGRVESRVVQANDVHPVKHSTG